MSEGTITRFHSAGGIASSAVYSPCLTYRYALSRVWDERSGSCCFVMLNPSTADEHRNDPTVERCERRARAMGFGGFCVVNIFAFRATDPADLKRAEAPEGPENIIMIQKFIKTADFILAAWGAHGQHQDQGAKVADVLRTSGRPVHHLGLTKYGHPRHPLYVSYRQTPQLWPL